MNEVTIWKNTKKERTHFGTWKKFEAFGKKRKEIRTAGLKMGGWILIKISL